MSPEEREKALKRAERRLSSKRGHDISPEIYLVAEFGYYFGWDGILAIKRGYIEKTDGLGKAIKEPFTLEEAMVLLEGARKVWASKVVDKAHATLIGTQTAYSKTPRDTFEKGAEPYIKKANLE